MQLFDYLTAIDRNIIKFVVIVGLLRLVMQLPEKYGKKLLFIIVNLIAISLLYRASCLDLRCLALYLGLLGLCYLVTRTLTHSKMWLIAALVPILLLIIARYMIAPDLAAQFIGASYMAFRLSQLVVIVRNQITPMP
ncbi:MAG: hypothetical protein K2Z81_19235, partial [Cyanobacteria bacterium]|nr:hypothetical protein [Cyanobacteriota bacterium]